MTLERANSSTDNVEYLLCQGFLVRAALLSTVHLKAIRRLHASQHMAVVQHLPDPPRLGPPSYQSCLLVCHT